MKVNKIISGGQTGVDIAALEVAKKLNIETGGWAPPDLQNEAGDIPSRFNLEPTPTTFSKNAPHLPRSLRTEWNVRDGDGTLIILSNENFTDPGTHFTLKTAAILSKPTFTIYLDSKTSVAEFHSWISSNLIKTLNVAGPAESNCTGIEHQAFDILATLLKK